MSSPQAALSAAQDCWNAGDLDGYWKLYDERIQLHGYSPEPLNKSQVRAFYEGIFTAFGPTKLDFHEVIWDGDSCAIRFSMTGRHVAEFMGVPPRTPTSCWRVSRSCTSTATKSSNGSRKPTCLGSWYRSVLYQHPARAHLDPRRAARDRLPGDMGNPASLSLCVSASRRVGELAAATLGFPAPDEHDTAIDQASAVGASDLHEVILPDQGRRSNPVGGA